MIDLGALKLQVKVDSDEANKKLDSFKKNTGELATKIKTGLASASKIAVAGFTAIAGAAVALVESTREYRTEQAKLETAFENAGFTAEEAKETYSELNSILGDSGQATEAANHLAKLANNQEDLATWTDIATGVFATFGDSLPIEGLTEAANETAKTGALTGSLADALNWAGVNEDDFQASLDGCSTEQERQALITETLNGLYSEAADGYRENAAEVIAANEANQKMTEGLASIAALIEPVVTAVKLLIAEGIQKLADSIKTFVEQNSEQIEVIKGFLSQVWDYFMFIIDSVIGILQEFVGFCIAFWNMYGETIISIIAPIWDSIKLLFENALTIIRAVFGVFKSFFEGDWRGLWENIKTIFTTLWDTIVKIVPNLMQSLINAFAGFYQALFDTGVQLFNSIWEGMKSIWESISSWVSEKVNWLVDKLAFWRNGQSEMDGSHRTGLREVPFDGYIAELHKGEMVLTAHEAKQYRDGETKTTDIAGNIVVNNYSPKALDEAESARQFKKAQREIALGVV